MNQNLINNDVQKFKVEKNYKASFIFDFITYSLFYIVPLSFFFLPYIIIPPHLLEIDATDIFAAVFLMVFCYILGIFVFRKFFKNDYPIFSAKFIITNECIEIKILNYSYLRCLWADIIKIEVIKEAIHPYLIEPRNKYKLTIMKRDESKEIRLHFFGFMKKKTLLTLKSLERFSKWHKTEFIKLKGIEHHDYKEKQLINDYKDIRNFYKNNKSKRKK